MKKIGPVFSKAAHTEILSLHLKPTLCADCDAVQLLVITLVYDKDWQYELRLEVASLWEVKVNDVG